MRARVSDRTISLQLQVMLRWFKECSPVLVVSGVAGPPGFEPGTYGLRASASFGKDPPLYLAELRALPRRIRKLGFLSLKQCFSYTIDTIIKINFMFRQSTRHHELLELQATSASSH